VNLPRPLISMFSLHIFFLKHRGRGFIFTPFRWNFQSSFPKQKFLWNFCRVVLLYRAGIDHSEQKSGRDFLISLHLYLFSPSNPIYKARLVSFSLPYPVVEIRLKLRFISLPRQWSNFHYRAYICLFNFNFTFLKTFVKRAKKIDFLLPPPSPVYGTKVKKRTKFSSPSLLFRRSRNFLDSKNVCSA